MDARQAWCSVAGIVASAGMPIAPSEAGGLAVRAVVLRAGGLLARSSVELVKTRGAEPTAEAVRLAIQAPGARATLALDVVDPAVRGFLLHGLRRPLAIGPEGATVLIELMPGHSRFELGLDISYRDEASGAAGAVPVRGTLEVLF